MELLKEYLDLTVFSLLGLMAFLALWITIERLITYKKIDLSLYKNEELLNIKLTNNLTTLSTIGANAPYVGLLGTVIGILITFFDMGQNQAIDTAAIMTGLALALKATAAGIAVAIPAIIAYNGLLRKVEVLNTLYSSQEQK